MSLEGKRDDTHQQPFLELLFSFFGSSSVFFVFRSPENITFVLFLHFKTLFSLLVKISLVVLNASSGSNLHLFQNKTVSHPTNRYDAQNDNTVTSLHLDFSLQRNTTKTSIVQRIVADDKVRRALVGTELELKLAQNFFSRLSEHNRASKKFFYAQIFFFRSTLFLTQGSVASTRSAKPESRACDQNSLFYLSHCGVSVFPCSPFLCPSYFVSLESNFLFHDVILARLTFPFAISAKKVRIVKKVPLLCNSPKKFRLDNRWDLFFTWSNRFSYRWLI